MSKGFEGIKSKVEQKKMESQRKQGQQFDGPPPLYFSIQDGETAHVRFLEENDDVHYADVHEIPVEGRSWGITVPCLDQDADGTTCPGCDKGLDRKFKGYINVVWFDAPVWKRDENQRLVKDPQGRKISVGQKTQTAIWSSGIRLFEKLEVINDRYKGLSSRRFEVTRKGKNLPFYEIVPVDIDGGTQDFSPTEQKLAQDKFDLNQFTVPGSIEDFQFRLGEGGSNNQQDGTKSNNPWLEV